MSARYKVGVVNPKHPKIRVSPHTLMVENDEAIIGFYAAFGGHLEDFLSTSPRICSFRSAGYYSPFPAVLLDNPLDLPLDRSETSLDGSPAPPLSKLATILPRPSELF
jgi:hypothetical protein